MSLDYDLTMRNTADRLAGAMGESYAALDADRRGWWEQLAREVIREREEAVLAAFDSISLDPPRAVAA